MPRVAGAAVVKILFIIANMLLFCFVCLMGGLGGRKSLRLENNCNVITCRYRQNMYICNQFSAYYVPIGNHHEVYISIRIRPETWHLGEDCKELLRSWKDRGNVYCRQDMEYPGGCGAPVPKEPGEEGFPPAAGAA